MKHSTPCLRRTQFSFAATLCGLAAFLLASTQNVLAAEPLEVGFHVVDITPDLNGDMPIYLAGLERNRVATDVRDKLYAQAIALSDGDKTIALVSVDSIGVQRFTIEAARNKLSEFDYVLVASTHTHAGPDCIGIWGPTETSSGINDSYLAQLEQGIVDAAKGAAAALQPAKAEYGTAADQSLLGDYRLPKVYDSVLRTVRFTGASDGKPCGILVQWNAHGIEPRDNPRITRDFFGHTVDELEQRHGCPVVYFSGAVGGLLGSPAAEPFLKSRNATASDAFEFMEIYGKAVADLADEALEQAEPIALTPIHVAATPISIPLDNQGYRVARKIGVLRRDAYEWTGNRDQKGAPVPRDQTEGDLAFITEVAYLRLGNLHVAGIPGEIYPELVYGDFQDPADKGADFPDAPLETPVMNILPVDRTLLLGLANDEVGYIIPKRQWDVEPPYCYGRTSSQYGEVNSVGPETARLSTEALADRVMEVGQGE